MRSRAAFTRVPDLSDDECMNRWPTLVALSVVTLTGCNLGKVGKDNDAGAIATADTASAAATASEAPAAASAHTAKAAASATAAKPKMPNCPMNTRLASSSLTPLKPFCSVECETDAECNGYGCLHVYLLKDDGTPEKGGLHKLCGVGKAAPTPTPSAAASGNPGAPPKCSPKEHYDDINKKCRPLGDCPSGYHWNDPMQSCVMDG
jgi:hypothetical protein